MTPEEQLAEAIRAIAEVRQVLLGISGSTETGFLGAFQRLGEDIATIKADMAEVKAKAHAVGGCPLAAKVEVLSKRVWIISGALLAGGGSAVGVLRLLS